MGGQTKQGFVAGLERVYGPALRRFLSARMRAASADAPDIFQEIFLRLLRIKDHQSVQNPQAYLYTVALHVLHQHALKRVPETMDPLELVAQLQSDMAPDPAEEAEWQQRLMEISRALEAHSPKAYAALVMYRCEGMTLEEIGARLGMSHTMARKYLTRAVAFCDEYLAEQEGV